MAYEHMLCEDTDPTVTLDERRKRATAEAKSICDIDKPDNGADVIVTIKVSGNALVSVLNAVQAERWNEACAAAREGVKPYPPHSLRLYAIVEQLRDQLTEERQRLRNPLRATKKFYIQVHANAENGDYKPIQFAAMCKDEEHASAIAASVAAAHGDVRGTHWDVEEA